MSLWRTGQVVPCAIFLAHPALGRQCGSSTYYKITCHQFYVAGLTHFENVIYNHYFLWQVGTPAVIWSVFYQLPLFFKENPRTNFMKLA